ncbi:hypothetical protein GGX14DRAFT_628966 [Mycena pura]|uniref:Uncharacterized protein n=1 Tax=Mycena pura TaxID=153505 RepID=A0AAD7E3Z2_9AGAR|nr:hypothetical protein GGX14DRAFT_628966 [Mycena pura]
MVLPEAGVFLGGQWASGNIVLPASGNTVRHAMVLPVLPEAGGTGGTVLPEAGGVASLRFEGFRHQISDLAMRLVTTTFDGCTASTCQCCRKRHDVMRGGWRHGVAGGGTVLPETSGRVLPEAGRQMVLLEAGVSSSNTVLAALLEAAQYGCGRGKYLWMVMPEVASDSMSSRQRKILCHNQTYLPSKTNLLVSSVASVVPLASPPMCYQAANGNLRDEYAKWPNNAERAFSARASIAPNTTRVPMVKNFGPQEMTYLSIMAGTINHLLEYHIYYPNHIVIGTEQHSQTKRRQSLREPTEAAAMPICLRWLALKSEGDKDRGTTAENVEYPCRGNGGVIMMQAGIFKKCFFAAIQSEAEDWASSPELRQMPLLIRKTLSNDSHSASGGAAAKPEAKAFSR